MQRNLQETVNPPKKALKCFLFWRVKPQGMGLIEIIIAIGLIVVVFPATHLLTTLSAKAVYDNIRKVEAAYLGQEGIEAVRTMRNKSWSATIAPLVIGTTYYPVISGNEWTQTTTNQGLINGWYTRTITIARVYRDGNDNIKDTGTEDTNTRKITVRVNWTSNAIVQEVQFETYLTNFLLN